MRSRLAALAFNAALLAGSAQAQPGKGNPWLQLPAEYQADLKNPLSNAKHYPWVQAAFNAWFEKWFTQGGKPKPGVGAREDYFHQYYFNQVLSRDERNSLILLYAKIKKENLWSVVKMVKWAGTGATMLFEPSMTQDELRKYLGARGYGDWWLASHGNPWGVRSRFRGVQLHLRGGDFVNIHIDLHNPGDPPSGKVTGALRELPQALVHFNDDLRNRAKTHTNPNLRAGLAQQGVNVPETD
jgi:hypothetical protein